MAIQQPNPVALSSPSDLPTAPAFLEASSSLLFQFLIKGHYPWASGSGLPSPDLGPFSSPWKMSILPGLGPSIKLVRSIDSGTWLLG